MNLVVEKELLQEYFNLLKPKAKSDKESHLISTIENPKNKFKISENYLALLEEYFTSKTDPQNLIIFQTYITQINLEDRIINIDSTKKLNEEEEIINCYKNQLQDYTFILLKSITPQISTTFLHVTSEYDKIDKPNKDWLILNLASRTICNVDSSDFLSQDFLNKFFQNFIQLSSNTSELKILDSYFNLNPTTVLNNIKGKKSKTHCYTRHDDLKPKDLKKRNIRLFFGNRTIVAFSTDKKILHERKILINDLVLEATHDFAEINVRNKNWNLYLLICENKQKAFLDNIANYT